MMDMLTNLLWQSFHKMYIYQIISLYTLNFHNVICRLYLIKLGRGGREEKLGGVIIGKIIRYEM